MADTPQISFIGKVLQTINSAFKLEFFIFGAMAILIVYMVHLMVVLSDRPMISPLMEKSVERLHGWITYILGVLSTWGTQLLHSIVSKLESGAKPADSGAES